MTERMMNKIIFITGAAGAGKTTVSSKLAEKYPKSLHIKVDDLRKSIVNGFAAPGGWTEEHKIQFQLGRTTATYMAKLYAANGFTVVIDDVCVPEFFAEQYHELFSSTSVHKILLMPKLTPLINRIRQRGGEHTTFFEKAVPALHSFLEQMPKADWLVLDSSDWTIEQTVAEVLQGINQ
jgi:adenylylsulfate kinase-like enzyme